MTPETKKHLREKYSIAERVRKAMKIKGIIFKELIKPIKEEIKDDPLLKNMEINENVLSTVIAKGWDYSFRNNELILIMNEIVGA